MFKITVNGISSIWVNKQVSDFVRIDSDTGERKHLVADFYGVDESALLIQEILDSKTQINAASATLTNLEKSEGVFCDAILNAYSEVVVAKMQTNQGIGIKKDRLSASFKSLVAQESLPGGIIDTLLTGNPTATPEEIFDALNIQDVDLRAYASIFYGVTTEVALLSVTPTAKFLEELVILALG